MKSNPFENYVCDGQMELADYLKDVERVQQPESYKRKPLIYHMGLSAYYFQCPYCRAENSEARNYEGLYCKVCGKYFDGVIERKTKDLIECEEQLGSSGGAVYKGEDGKWHYSDLETQQRKHEI